MSSASGSSSSVGNSTISLHELVRKVEANEMRSHMTSFGVQEALIRDSAGTMAVSGTQDRMLKEQQKIIEDLKSSMQ